jgi:hypothetical protein
MRWGFVSPTAKVPKLVPINARAETLSTSPMFRDAFRRHRCVVVADGFYEVEKERRTMGLVAAVRTGYNEVCFDPARPATRRWASRAWAAPQPSPRRRLPRVYDGRE